MVWLTPEQRQALLEDPNLPLQPAPPICVEIISPSNTVRQMEEKRGIYFATGANEVWICERSGKMRFFDSAGEMAHSRLVPQFPAEISIEEERRPELKRRARSLEKLPLDPGTPRPTPEPPARGR